MKQIITLIIVFFTASAAFAQMDSATMMKNWQSYMTPGEPHKKMAEYVGKWKQEILMWHAPGMEPEKSYSESEIKMLMGGRYMVETNKGTMMGMPFEGVNTLAYDNARKKYISTWIDNVGTGLMVMEGDWDPKTNSVTLTGNMVDPSAGDGSTMKMKQIWKAVDKNNHMFTMYASMPDGSEFKMMEIRSTRK